MPTEPTVAGFGLEFGMEATHELMAAATDGAEQASRVLEAGLTLVPGPSLVVAAESMVAVAGRRAEPAVPRGAGLSAVVGEEAEVVAAAPMGPGAAASVSAGLEAEPTLVPFAAYLGVESATTGAEQVFAPEGSSTLDEHGLEVVLAPEADSMTSGCEGSMNLSALGAVLVPEGPGVRPRKAGTGTALHLLPEAGLGATNVMIAAAASAFAFVPQPRWCVQVGSDLQNHSLPEL